MNEHLKRVEAFAELRAGMIVVIKPCDWCGGIHRGIVAKWVADRPALANEKGLVDRAATGWGVLPPPPCSHLPSLIATDDLLTNVFRVIDPNLEHETTTRKRKKERA